jgi:lipid A disaccharide synthetase
MEKERYGLENLIQERQLESEILQEDIQRKSLQQQLLEKSYLESEQKLRAEHQEMATMLGEAFAQAAETNRVEYEYSRYNIAFCGSCDALNGHRGTALM